MKNTALKNQNPDAQTLNITCQAVLLKGGIMKNVHLTLLALLTVIIAGCSTGYVAKSDKAVVDMYVMSQCPYGVQAENAIAPVLATLRGSVDFNLHFIGRGDSLETFQSLHGEPEWRGDMVQACAIKYEPENFMDLVVCMNQNPNLIPDNWEACADELNLDKQAIMECYDGEEGKQLLEQSFQKSEMAGAQGSPTIKINGEDYNGQRNAQSFTRAICQYVNDPACEEIAECTQAADCPPKEGKIPQCVNPGTEDARCEYQEDAQVALTVVNDEDCANCDPAQIIGSLGQIFLNLDVEQVDIGTREGKELVGQHNLQVVPAFIFGENIEQSYIWQSNEKVRALFEETNGRYKLLDEVTGATHFVSEEKRQEMLQKIGVELGDNRPQIDFFVMSYCPYGNIAEEIIEEVYNEIGDSADFNPHYVIYSNYGGPDFCLDDSQEYCSMHGLTELNQGVRELCVNKHYGTEEWFEFARAMNSGCTAENADSCWQPVAENLNLDVQTISDCEENEAVDLLAKEKELNQLLGVQGSPTIFIEGQAYNGQRDANSILGAMCNSFDAEKPAGCDNVIESASAQQVASGACG